MPATELRVGLAAFGAADTGTIATIGLGSCVAIVLYDPAARVGGLAHVLLPSESMSRDRSNPGKFPSTAIPLVLQAMCRLGARRDRIEAKIAGGASMFASFIPSGGINIGERNVRAVREGLGLVGIPIVAEDTGSDHGRSVYLYVADGRVEVRSVRKGSRVL